MRVWLNSSKNVSLRLLVGKSEGLILCSIVFLLNWLCEQLGSGRLKAIVSITSSMGSNLADGGRLVLSRVLLHIDIG
jgi:hypothetical protein